ncbi:hypothetical protein GCM10027317_12090 [Massilia agri]
MLLGRDHRHPGGVALRLFREMVDHTHGVQVLAKGEAPGAQAAVFIHQFKVADAGVVVVVQFKIWTVSPVGPGLFAGRAREQAAVSDHHQALGET